MNVGYLIATVDELGLNNDDTWKGDVSAVLESLKKLEVLEILDDNTNESPHGGIIAHSVSIRRNVPMRPLPSDLPSRYNHKDCSWVPDLKSEADAASNIDFTLTLWDFPSRRIHYW